jgi:O-succinylbenzoate synthase
MNSNQKAERIGRSDLIPAQKTESPKFSLKKKIGLLPVTEEIEKIKEWFQYLDPSSKVRLDANGSLSMEELSHWSTELSSENRIEYLEQPVSDDFRDELFEFSRNSKLPLAIDETIVAMGSPQSAKDNGWNGFYVLKPTLLPNWNLTLKFAKENPATTVFSTVYESPFGYEALVRASVFSELEPGLNRENLKSQTKEFPSHHVDMLESPSATTRELNELWAKFD